VTDLPVGEALETAIEEPDGSLDLLTDAGARAAAARYPECLAAWGALGDEALEDGRAVEAYAFYRVGYHRGLDRIRKAGWRGAGRVPWRHEGNRGFLRSLAGLGKAATAIGEEPEAQRCREFLEQLAPDAPEDVR
jgi:hypothetical protein